MSKLKLISLFSGIGAYERGLQELGIDYDLQFFCELDDKIAEAYSLLHKTPLDKNLGDIETINLSTVKGCDLLVYSPPCQSFSIAGKKKGLKDIRGTLFWNALDVIKAANPKYAIMENVSNLANGFKEEFDNMLMHLEDAGYNNYWSLINAKYFIPQNRERVFVVSIRKDIDDGEFKFPVSNNTKSWWEFIDPYDVRPVTGRQQRMIDYVKGKNSIDKIKIEGEPQFENAVITLRQSGLRFQSNREHPAITAHYGKGGGNFTILAYNGHVGGIPPSSCFKLMGFKKEDVDLLKEKGFSNSNLYVMAGNSVVVPVIREIQRTLLKNMPEKDRGAAFQFG